MSRRKYYIPITRSGSSMLASVGTQMLGRLRAAKVAAVTEQLERGEISEWTAFFYIHPFISWFLFTVVGTVGYCILASLFGWK